MSLGNGTYSYAASYDTGIRLTSAGMSTSSGNTLLYQTQPTYDAVNNVVGVQTSVGGQTDTQQFCYDDLNRLTWSGTNGTPPCSGQSIVAGTLTSAQYQQSNTYTVESGLVTGPSGSYTYGASSHPHAVTSTSKGYSAAYDASGNMTCRATTTATTCSGSSPTGQQLSYDAEGRLSLWQNQPTSPTQSVNYLYDGSGNRVAMQSTVSGTTTLTSYIGSLEEVQTSGGTTQTTTYYSVEGKRIAADVNGTFYYFGYDALGSQVAVLSAAGSLVGAQLYSPYGTSRYNNGTLPTSIGFTGQRADSITGLDYYVARYYDPNVGQFLSTDSVQGNAVGMNPYAYVDGNPETYTDPTGLDPEDLHNPAYEQAVIDWYKSIEVGNTVYGNQDKNGTATRIPGGGITDITSASRNLSANRLIENVIRRLEAGGSGADTYGYPDIVNVSSGLIYDVKGGTLSPDGSVGYPTPNTIFKGYTQVRYYMEMANKGEFYGKTGWNTGNLRTDKPLNAALNACPNRICTINSGSAQIHISYAGGGVLTYQVTNEKKPTPAVVPQGQAHRYSVWQELFRQRYQQFSDYRASLGALAYVVAAAVVVSYVASGGLSYGGGGGGGGGGGCSFTPDTMVGTVDGEKLISSLQVNDMVVSYNFVTHVVEPQPIVHVWVHPDDDLVDVVLIPEVQSFMDAKPDSETLHTTSTHPFLTQERGFVPAANLRVGMHVLKADKTMGVVALVTKVPGVLMMYNLEVAVNHTFTVGKNRWIVHNLCRPVI